MKKLETSKLVLGMVLAYCGLFALAILVGWFMGKEDATGLLAAICVPAGTALGYYYWKAKNENLNKHEGTGVNIYAIGEEQERFIGFCNEDESEDEDEYV